MAVDTVLVLADKPFVKNLICAILRAYGTGVWPAIKLFDIFPAIRVLLTSGMPMECWHSKDLTALRALLPRVRRFLQEPFPASILRDAVRELLERKADEAPSST